LSALNSNLYAEKKKIIKIIMIFRKDNGLRQITVGKKDIKKAAG
jgi:hypothetical protein